MELLNRIGLRMPGLKRRSSSKGRKPLLDALVSGPVKNPTGQKGRSDFVYVSQRSSEWAKMEPYIISEESKEEQQNRNTIASDSNPIRISDIPTQKLASDQPRYNQTEMNGSGTHYARTHENVAPWGYGGNYNSEVLRDTDANASYPQHSSVDESDSRVDKHVDVKPKAIVQLPVGSINRQIGESLDTVKEPAYGAEMQQVQMRQKKGRVHMVQADVHSVSSHRDSWLEGEVFDVCKMNTLEHDPPPKSADVQEKEVDMTGQAGLKSNVDSTKSDGQSVKLLKQQRKMLKRLLKIQSEKHTEASEDIKRRAENLIDNIKQKQADLLEKLQKDYEETAFEILGKIEELDSEITSKVKSGSKRNSLLQEVIDKDSLNDSSEPDELSTVSEEITQPALVTNGYHNDNNDAPSSDKVDRLSKRLSLPLGGAFLTSQKFIPGDSLAEFGSIETRRVSMDAIRKTKNKKERRNADGSSVSSDPRRSWLFDAPQLSVCQEGTCNLSWFLDRESRNRGPLLNVEGLTFTNSGDLVVAEHSVSTGRLQIFDAQGKSKLTIGEGMLFPWNVTMQDNSTLVVPCRDTKSLKTVNLEGQLLDEWSSDIFIHPSAVAFSEDKQYIYVTDTDKCKITVHRLDGELVGKLRAIENGDNLLGNPVSVAVSYDGFVAVLDKTNHCIHLFDNNGTYLYQFGKNGQKDGQLKHPSSLCMDHTGNIYVADSHNNRVSKFSLQGMFVEHTVTEEDAVLDPTCVAVSKTGQLAVADAFGIKVFDITI